MARFKELEGEFRVAPFPQKVHVIVSTDIHRSFKKRNHYMLASQEPTATSGACTVTNPDHTHIWLFLPFTAVPPTIVHESYHIIAHTLRQNGVGNDDEEVWAYHLDETFVQVTQILATARKKGKNGIRKKS